jgi:hypothetical protein
MCLHPCLICVTEGFTQKNAKLATADLTAVQGRDRTSFVGQPLHTCACESCNHLSRGTEYVGYDTVAT